MLYYSKEKDKMQIYIFYTVLEKGSMLTMDTGGLFVLSYVKWTLRFLHFKNKCNFPSALISNLLFIGFIGITIVSVIDKIKSLSLKSFSYKKW